MFKQGNPLLMKWQGYLLFAKIARVYPCCPLFVFQTFSFADTIEVHTDKGCMTCWHNTLRMLVILSTEELMEDSEEGEDWEECEDQTEVSKVTCLFCSMTFTSAEDTFTHCQSAHDLDLIRWGRQHRLDCIQYIKMINYIRLKVSPPPFFLKAINGLILLTFLLKSCISWWSRLTSDEMVCCENFLHYQVCSKFFNNL